MRMAILGPPGSGKGTQAQRICQTFDLVHLASGDLLRAEKASGTEFGLKVREYMDKGLLVPDELMVQLMKNKILSLTKGFVLDGFPRTLAQAKTLNRMLFEVDRPLMLVINFVVKSDVLARRFSGRRTCPKCQAVYHIDAKPPKQEGICDVEGAKLIIRDDDKPEVVAQRLKTYDQTMAPLVAYYTQLGNFKTVEASGSVDEVTKAVLEKIRRHFAE